MLLTMRPLQHLAPTYLPTYNKIFMYTVRKPNLSGLNLESGKNISISEAIAGSFRFLQPLPHLHVRIVWDRSYIYGYVLLKSSVAFLSSTAEQIINMIMQKQWS